jgi:hypothetical protein
MSWQQQLRMHNAAAEDVACTAFFATVLICYFAYLRALRLNTISFLSNCANNTPTKVMPPPTR